jgi:hypothetical protein
MFIKPDVKQKQTENLQIELKKLKDIQPLTFSAISPEQTVRE